MLTIRSLDRNLPLFQALSSELRAEIFMLLTARESLTLKELSDHFQLSPATLKPHLQKLMECQLVYAEEPSSRSGTQYHARDCGQISIDFSRSQNICSEFQTEIPVGQYADFSVSPRRCLFWDGLTNPVFSPIPPTRMRRFCGFPPDISSIFCPTTFRGPVPSKVLRSLLRLPRKRPSTATTGPRTLRFP